MKADEQLRLPYPGLRSFRREETDLFFGRESSVDEMVDRLAQSRFLAVLGASGSGKSSLVRTGLLDALELGLLTEAGSHWRVIDIHPGGEPLRNLARGLLGRDAGPSEVEHMRAFLERGPRSVIEWCRDGHLQPDENLLLLVDQFEELFRYQHYEERQEAEAFVGLLLESARNRGVPVYIVITMRSEFLSACALIDGLAEAMNRGQYLTPRMSRDQCRTAIEGPAAVCGFKIEPDLVNRILNDLSDFAPWDETADQSSQLDRMVRRADQLPLLEHALNRLWVRAVKAGGDIVLRLDDYLALGGLKGTLHGHLTHILNELGPEKRKTAEAIFRALTVGTSIADAVRRPTRISELAAISGAKLAEVVEVCEAFRAPGRSFLTPPGDTLLAPETVVDISHESLIRQWRDLSDWLEKEAQDADALRRLDTAAQRAKAQKGDYLAGRDLANLSAWYDETKPTEPWAKRYVKDPGAAFEFLSESIANEKGRSSWELRRRVALLSLAFIVPILVTGLLWVWNTSVKLEDARNELSAKVEQLSKLNTDLEATRKDLDAKNKELGAAQEELATNLNKTVDTVMDFVGRKVDELQLAGDFDKSGNLLAAFIEKTRRDGGEVIPRVLKRFAPRFALQVAANGSRMVAVGEGDPRGTRMSPAVASDEAVPLSAFSLWKSPGSRGISVVDERTGRTTAVFDFDEGTLGELALSNSYFLSPDGRHALLIGKDGRLFRWSMGEQSARRILDRRWLKKSYTIEGKEKVAERTLQSAAFDDKSGAIAVIFNEFETDFLTVIGVENAWLAPSWPVHRILTAMNAASLGVQIIPTSASIADDPTPPDVVGVMGADVVLELSTEQPGGELRGLALFNDGSRRARWLISPSRFLDSQPTTDPHRIHVLLRATAGKCEEALTPGQLAQDAAEISADTGLACAADFSLESRQLVTKPRPVLPNSFLALEPIGEIGSDILIQPSLRPAWRPSNTSNKGPADNAPEIVWWANIAGRMSAVSRTEDNFVATALSDNGKDLIVLDANEAGVGRGEPGRGLDPKWYVMPALPTGAADYRMDGAGKVALTSGGGKLFAWFVDKQPAQWSELALVDRAQSCKLRAQQANTSASENPAARLQSMTFVPVSNSHPVFVAYNKGEELSLISVMNAAQPTAEVACFDGIIDEILDRDFVGNSVLVRARDLKGNVIAKLQLREEEGHFNVAVASFLEPGIGEDAKQAALLGDGRIVTVDNSGNVALFDLAKSSTEPTKTLAAVLPAGTKYQFATHGSMALLLREDGGVTDMLWTSAMVVDFGNEEPRVAFTGLVPINLSNMEVVRLADEQGLIEFLTSNSVFQIRLSPTQTAETLALAVEALGDASSIDGSERAIVALGAQALALTERDGGDNDVPPQGHLDCAVALERAIRTFEETGDITGRADDARGACSEDAIRAPTAAAILELLAAKVSDAGGKPQTWPRPASEILAAAAAGDITALGVLFSWGTHTEETYSPLKVASASLLQSLFKSSIDERWRLEPRAGFASYLENASEDADAYGHRMIAALSEIAPDIPPDRRNMKKSLRHYWMAEGLFKKTEDAGNAKAVARRRVALARSLPLTDVAAVAKDVLAWTPTAKPLEIPAVATETSQRLRQDVAAIDRLANQIGPDRSWDLLKLHVLSILAATDASAREEIANLLLARDDWPSSNGREPSALLQVMEQAAEYLPQDDVRRTRLWLRLIETLERSDPLLEFNFADVTASPVATYQRALDNVLADLSRYPDRKAQVTYFPGKRTFAFSDMRVGNGSTYLALQKALAARVSLIDALAGGQDLALARHATRYWQAISLEDSYTKADFFFPTAEKELRKKKYLEYLRESFTGFTAALRGGPIDDDSLAVAVLAADWFASERATYNFDDERSGINAVMQRSQHLVNLTERGAWLPVFGTVFDNQLSLLGQLAHSIPDEPNEDEVNTADANRRRLRDLTYAAASAQTEARGNISIQGETGLLEAIPRQSAYAIAYVAGQQAWRSRPGEHNNCDVEAASPFDPKRRAPGKQSGNIDVPRARAACEAVLAGLTSDDPTTVFQLGRAIGDSDASPDILKDKLLYYARAARAGYAIAFNNLGFEANRFGVETKDLFAAYVSRVNRDHFADAYKALKPLVQTPGEESALRIFAVQSADLGSSAANEILASLESDPAEKKYRLLIAQRSLPEGDLNSARLKAEAEAILLGEEDELWIGRRLEVWQPGQIPALAEDIVEQILAKKATR